MMLSVVIPARNEAFLKQTVEDILKNKRGETEIIVGLDGYWPDPALVPHPDLTIIYYPVAIGQRALTNQCVKLSRAKYVMKVDAHCAFDEGFDVKMAKALDEAGPHTVMAPGMRNLWCFDWKCYTCGRRVYQDKENICPPNERHAEPVTMKKKVVWIAKTNPFSTAYCFTPEPHFQYMGDMKRRKEYERGMVVGYDLSFKKPSLSPSVVSLLTNLAGSHPFPIDTNLSSDGKDVAPNTMGLSSIDNSGKVGAIEVLSVGNELEMQGVATSPVLADVVDDGNVSTPSFGNTANKPRIDETVCHFMISEIPTVPITVPVDSPNPVPTPRNGIGSKIINDLNSILGGEFVYSENADSFHNGSVTLKPIYRKDINETMSLQGSAFMCRRDEYWDLGICDEDFGSWGSQGIEVACKYWLSGGRVLVNRATWYAHMFRTKPNFSFPYDLSGRQVQNAKKRAKDLFFNNKWDKAIYPLSWLVEKFMPIPGWDESEIAKLKEMEKVN